MATTLFELSGRVTRSDTQQGVHGVRIEAWDAEHTSKGLLGMVLTNRDGSYHIDLCRDRTDVDYCECPKVYLKLRDRDCRLIHDGCAERRCCEPGQPLRIDVALAPEALWWHLSRPLSWERIDGPLIPIRVMQEIEDGLELLHAGGLPHDLASLKLAACATPSVEGFDRLLQDAWGTLQGDPHAAQRYREVLDALCGTEGACCGEHSPFTSEVDALFEGACTAPPATECKEPAPCAPCSPKECTEGDCSCGAPVISNEKALLLAMAALHVTCSKQAVAKRYLQVLLGQFCRFATLRALHAASLKSLLGDDAAKAHARDLLELLCAQGSPTHDRSSCTPHQLPSCCVPCMDPKLARCLREAVEQWCRIHCYHVYEVRPPRACPGEEILIAGCGFGERPGRVVFRGQGSTSIASPSVAAKRWCDDRITVFVPQGAGCGMWLELPLTTIAVCDRFLELRPIGCIGKDFEGTSAEILRFDVKGHTTGECPLQPGEPLRIRWNTCAADRVRIELIDLANSNVIAAQDPAAVNGRWDFTATQFTRTVRLRVRITAFGRCRPPQVSRQIDLVFQNRPNLQVQGLEVTQSIQYYRANQHLTDAADRGLDNSLRLVTNKTAWVRCYLRSGQDPLFEDGQLSVNGTLRIERRIGGVWNTIANLASQNGPIVAEDSFASYDAERRNINTTLNFVVPANLMTGLLRLTAVVVSPFAPCPGNSASGSTQVDVNLQQTLNAAFITIGYNGPNATNTGNIVLAAPALAQCQSETSWAMTTYPVSGAPNVRSGGTFVTNTPLNDPRSCPGCCSPNWGPLLNQIAALVALDQVANPGQWVYYGIIAGGIPVNVPGCSGGTATGGLAGSPVTYAHEIGHQFGLPHARCGNAGNGNPSFPVYEPYDLPVDPPNTDNWTMASIGEYGLDINSGAIANPNDSVDFMSYCGPRWISLFTYNFLTNLATLAPQAIPTGSGSAAPRLIEDEPMRFERDEWAIEPMIHMLGMIGADGKVEVASVARIDTRYLRGNGRQTGYIAQHLDAGGRIIAEDNVYGYPSEGCAGKAGSSASGRCGCGDCRDPQPILFKAMLQDLAPGAILRLVKRDGEVVWERHAAAKPRTLAGARAALNKNGELELTWKLGGGEPKDEVEVWVRWTNDEGKTWHALTVGLRGNSATISAEQLPSGSVRFELFAHDGFHTVRAATNEVTLPAQPPAVTILYPNMGARVYPDRLIHLWGAASSFAGATIDPEAAEWFIDDKPVGKGLDLWVENPGARRHSVCLQVTEGELTGAVTHEIEVLGD